MSQRFRHWIGPVTAILLLQTTASFITRLVPTIAPAFIGELHWTETSIGYLAAVNTVGAMVVLLIGTPVIRRMGSIRSLQISLAIGALSLALFPIPLVAAPLVASFLIGLSYGVATPAGTDVLQRYAPPHRRNLIFSIKQAGVPLGGVIAGIFLPPLVQLAGWRTTLVIAALVVFGVTGIAQSVQAKIDGPRDRYSSLTTAFPNKLRLLWQPLTSLRSAPGVLRLSLVGASLAVVQSCWFAFAVTYLVSELNFSLTAAGFVFAVMQGMSVIGRIAVGWVADRVGSGTFILRIAAVSSAAASIVFGLSSVDWPSWAIVLLAGAAGLSISSWNGVQIAEIARRSPSMLVGETAAGSTILVFASTVIAPFSFALFVGTTHRFDYAFFIIAVASLLSLPALIGIDRATVSPAGAAAPKHSR